MTQLLAQAYISDRAGLNVVDFIADEASLSKAKIKDCVMKGGVWLKRDDEDPVRIKQVKADIKLDDEVHIYYDEALLKQKPVRLELLFDAQQYSVWRQPEGVMTQLSLYSDHLMLQSILLKQIPHDRDCYLLLPSLNLSSGLMLVAHTRNIAARFQTMEEQGEIERSLQVKCFGKKTDLPNLLEGFLPVECMSLTPAGHAGLTLDICHSQNHEMEVMESIEESSLDDKEELFSNRVELHSILLEFTCPLTGELQRYSL